MRKRSHLYRVLTIAAVGFLAACGDISPNISTTPSVSPIAGIQVLGPDWIGPSQSAQFVANILQADGTTKSATRMPNLRWTSSDTSVMFVNNSGVVTGIDPSFDEPFGEAVITAELMDQPAIRGTREVVIQPAGTYRVVGSVHEADAPANPIAGARVELLLGFRYTITNSAGQYRLYAVPPQSTIRITAPGYETIDQPLELTANVTRDFRLNVNGPRLR